MLFITAASLLAAVFQVVLAQNLQINTISSATECQPVQFTWTGGVAPYYLSLVPGGQPSAQPVRRSKAWLRETTLTSFPQLKQFPTQNGNSMTWTVDFPEGTTFSSSLKDSTGEQAFSDIQTVQSGTDSSCLNSSTSDTMSMSSTTMVNSASSMSSSAASMNTATTPSASGTSRGTSTTSSMSGSSESGTGVRAGSSSATASSTGSSNAASTPASAGAMGLAGILGLFGAAFLG
ncbi:hypothetical protein OH76DRAFT_1475480 [Lentinus brumalis]|uniref:Uncharacterized protein n=1 Tax=Lentinus brumalis TaxID=2498619 RepID=A0A371CPK0_9APHY|nr:hypothetical protein OH76DRAFT_1475480 [Polyporus brumalis]